MIEKKLHIEGEGNLRVRIETRVRRGCDNCEEAATKKHNYCFVNGRSNPASSMYRKDDCSYCSDAEAFACDACNEEVKRVCCPDGMSWASTFSLRPGYEHFFLHWESRAATLPELDAIAKATGEQQ